MSLVHRRTVMTPDRIERALHRIAAEILERGGDLERIALIGIRAGGVGPTMRIAQQMKDSEGINVPVGMIDITLYRDDISSGHKPVLMKTEIDFDVTDKCIVLVDDVLFTGRTIRAAMDAVMDYGRPSCIRVAVLVDRGHRELPIQPDFVGQVLDTDRDEKVTVHVGEKRSRADKVEVFLNVEPEEGQS